MTSSNHKQLESQFQSKLKQDVKYLHPGIFWHKLTDSIMTENTRFIPKKPFDIFAVNNNIPYGIETKAHNNHRRFSITPRTREQIENLLEFKKSCQNNNQAFLIINVKYELNDTKVNYAIYFKPEEITLDMKSIDVKVENNTNRIFYREKIKGKTVWNLTGIIK